jgi:hypothetical protein
MQVCPQCQRDRLVNNGSAAGKPLTTKIHAVWLYLRGISVNRMAFLLRVSAQAVLHWIRTVAQKYEEKPAPTGRSIILELDGCGMTCSRNGRNSGSGRPWIRTPGHGWPGNVGAVTRQP